MNNSFKKAALLCAALMTSVSTFAISTGGAVAAGLGAAAAVTLISVGIHKHNKRKREQQENNKGDVTSAKKMKKSENKSEHKSSYRSRSDEKREIKDKILDKREELRDHKYALNKLNRKGKGKTSEATEHKSIMKTIKAELKKLDADLRNL